MFVLAALAVSVAAVNDLNIQLCKIRTSLYIISCIITNIWWDNSNDNVALPLKIKEVNTHLICLSLVHFPSWMFWKIICSPQLFYNLFSPKSLFDFNDFENRSIPFSLKLKFAPKLWLLSPFNNFYLIQQFHATKLSIIFLKC